MKCQVTSDTTRKVMIGREGKIPSYKEICGGEKKKVNLGYVNEIAWFWVSNNSLLRYPAQSGLKLRGSRPWISHEWEVLPAFFRAHNIQPNWVYCDQIYGTYNEKQGHWTGCMGKVQTINNLRYNDLLIILCYIDRLNVTRSILWLQLQ